MEAEYSAETLITHLQNYMTSYGSKDLRSDSAFVTSDQTNVLSIEEGLLFKGTENL